MDSKAWSKFFVADVPRVVFPSKPSRFDDASPEALLLSDILSSSFLLLFFSLKSGVTFIGQKATFSSHK